MKRKEWEAIKAYIDAKANEAVDKAVEQSTGNEPGIWLGTPPVYTTAQDVEALLEDDE